jgi:carbon storage regulator
MLILARKIGEMLRIGDDIKVTVLTVHGHQVRIGINAPRNVVVDREEIAERKKREIAAPEPPSTAGGGEAPTIRIRKSRHKDG